MIGCCRPDAMSARKILVSELPDIFSHSHHHHRSDGYLSSKIKKGSSFAEKSPSTSSGLNYSDRKNVVIELRLIDYMSKILTGKEAFYPEGTFSRSLWFEDSKRTGGCGRL